MHPRFGEKMMTSFPSRTCTPPLLVSIKGEAGSIFSIFSRSLNTHTHTRSPEHDIGTCLNHLAETWELPSLSRLACTPYYRHPGCKTVQCSHTPLCWTYDPMAGTRINPCITVLPLASTSGTRNTQHHHWLGPDRRVRTPTVVITKIIIMT